MPELQVYYGLRTIVYEVTPEGHWKYIGWVRNGLVPGYHRKSDGRPVISIASMKHYVYRLTFRAIRGYEVPEGLVPDHTCLAKWCIFPDHLDPVKQIENMTRAGVTGGDQHVGHGLKTHCPANHEYNAENTYVHERTRVKNGKTSKYTERQCKLCMRETKRRNRAELREMGVVPY
jgi:hypothetical protein